MRLDHIAALEMFIYAIELDGLVTVQYAFWNLLNIAVKEESAGEQNHDIIGYYSFVYNITIWLWLLGAVSISGYNGCFCSARKEDGTHVGPVSVMNNDIVQSLLGNLIYSFIWCYRRLLYFIISPRCDLLVPTLPTCSRLMRSFMCYYFGRDRVISTIFCFSCCWKALRLATTVDQFTYNFLAQNRAISALPALECKMRHFQRSLTKIHLATRCASSSSIESLHVHL